ncbi:MAG: PAS domain-containing protein [Candidatus Tectomicrobia bacterium]|uniref:histidine kinase n=1 Tax=Tectimicrobiota bacterium TaxID=2528274 RepID=A0A933GK13_UNCTE|nr:PAS domain-containing protein [Candidatus Tectomicrobia bacterium]
MKSFSGFHSLSFKVVCGVISTLVLISGIFFFLFYHLHRQQLVSSLNESTSRLARMIETNLEHAMLNRDLALLTDMLTALAQEQGVEDIKILNKEGIVTISPDLRELGMVLNQGEVGCQLCHSLPPERRTNSAIIVNVEGRRVFRNMTPIFNKPQCFSCHERTNKINGVLLMDFSMESIESHLTLNIKEMILWTGLMVSATVLVIFILMNRLILNKLKLFVRKTQLVGKGKLDERISVSGKDEISELGGHFNRMTENLEESMERIKEHKEYLENILNSVDDGLVVVDREYRIVLANTAFLAKFNLNREQSMGSCCQDGALGELSLCTQLNVRCPMRETFRTGGTHKTTLSFNGKQGKESCVEIYSSPIFDERGQPVQGVEVWRDITERKELEANLSHSERLASLGVLASGLAHEINNPLASISACIEGIQRRLDRIPEFNWTEQKDVEEYFKLVLKEIQRTKETTQKLLILSRKSPLSADPIDINQSLRETLSLLRHEAEANNINIIERYGSSLPSLKGDEPQIRQVFLNIARNGLQAIGQDGILRVRTGFSQDQIFVTFEDTGCGLAEGDLARVFEPFFSRKRDGKGLGLGLFIAHSIVKKHHGEIKVESRIGQGSTFTVVFSLEGAESPSYNRLMSNSIEK